MRESEAVADSVGVKARDFALLLKPRVMSLVVFTGLVGLILAPGTIDPWTGALAVVLIAVGAGASGAVNMWYDRDIDAHMKRTKNRPIPAGRVTPGAALALGTVLSVASVAAMAVYVNALAGALLAVTIAYYVFIYTMWLKRRTPQNIVIGGAAGAFPPMIGWAAVTGGVDLGAVILFLIIFMWTPPHFWALALYATGDYEKVGVPMLPVVSGVRETKKQIIIYSVLLLPITLVPSFIGMSGWVYGVGVAVLGLMLIRHSVQVWRTEDHAVYRRMFFFSIKYLFMLFVLLLADRAIHTYLL
ncbi:MAG: protoheme IX farnesyltransferase [Hyphomicrobiales bacterium]|nr:protoheme IX farnesyltransferase [Hyphomicrobiales bacterium]